MDDMRFGSIFSPQIDNLAFLTYNELNCRSASD